MTKTKVKKSALKEGYYYEYKPWYDACPATLSVPKYKTEIFPKNMTHKEILETYKITPYASFAEVAAVAISAIPTFKNDYKGRLVYFMDGDTSCRLYVWRDVDGYLKVGVREVGLGSEWGAGVGVLFSNSISDTSHETLGNLDTLALACKIKEIVPTFTINIAGKQEELIIKSEVVKLLDTIVK